MKTTKDHLGSHRMKKSLAKDCNHDLPSSQLAELTEN
jgi:hypothetical protein